MLVNTLTVPKIYSWLIQVDLEKIIKHLAYMLLNSTIASDSD